MGSAASAVLFRCGSDSGSAVASQSHVHGPWRLVSLSGGQFGLDTVAPTVGGDKQLRWWRLHDYYQSWSLADGDNVCGKWTVVVAGLPLGDLLWAGELLVGCGFRPARL